MNHFNIAIATDDENLIANRHFGEAKSYLIYNIQNNSAEFLSKIENTSRRESNDSGHGDAAKAMDVKNLLKRRDVDVILGHKIGPNITRIRKRFVPIVSRKRDIEDTLGLVVRSFSKIYNEIKKDEKEHFILR
ncbi:MAG: NifB/NifX family molybdenum-iron cluster-binding protein [Candidatus Zixiibacteriota bacterium]